MGVRKSLDKARRYTIDWLKAEQVRFFGDVKRIDLPAIPMGQRPRLCLLAHYSDDGGFADFLYFYVQALLAADCDVLVISSAPTFNDADQRKLLALGVGLVQRRNVGYDFGSWRTGLGVLPQAKQQYKTLLFANDSVYGPFSDLGAILDAMAAEELDLWALTGSAERQPHLQTYFWAIANKGLSEGFFDYFWFHYYRYYSIRRRVIDRYELQIKSIAEARFGLKTGVYIGQDKLASLDSPVVNQIKANPTQHFALELVRDYGFPFVKRELLLSDPFKLGIDDALEQVLVPRAPQLWAMAMNHVANLKQADC